MIQKRKTNPTFLDPGPESKQEVLFFLQTPRLCPSRRRERRTFRRSRFRLGQGERQQIVDLTLRVRKLPHAEREVYDLLPLA